MSVINNTNPPPPPPPPPPQKTSRDIQLSIGEDTQLIILLGLFFDQTQLMVAKVVIAQKFVGQG